VVSPKRPSATKSILLRMEVMMQSVRMRPGQKKKGRCVDGGREDEEEADDNEEDGEDIEDIEVDDAQTEDIEPVSVFTLYRAKKTLTF
jgi:hypothetical protein